MTQSRKKEIISQIIELITEIAYDKDDQDLSAAELVPKKVEMLTIKECTEVVCGLSEHTVRKLVAQGKIPYIRAGQGNHGKMLINKDCLIDYFKNNV